MRREFEMTEADLAGIMARINAARNTPLIALQCGMPQSPQEAANDAWAELGKRLGFDPFSVEPGKSNRHFTAVPQPAPPSPTDTASKTGASRAEGEQASKNTTPQGEES